MAKKLIVANWKMNPESLREAREIFVPIKRAAAKLSKVRLVVCPPAIYLPSLANGGGVSLGGQDAFYDVVGPYTGEISPVMLKKAGAEYVIIGHSEKRAHGDTDQIIQQKIRTALRVGLKVILCVGEASRDHHGFYLKFVRQQLEEDLKNIPRRFAPQLIIAYEPLWAIGSNAVASDTPAGFLEQALFIRKVLSGIIGASVARAVPVLYGGSVTVKNALGFLAEGAADGLLVGRESLEASHFIAILKLANSLSA